MSHLLDDPLLAGEMPSGEVWGEPDVDVDLLAEAFFESGGAISVGEGNGDGFGLLQNEEKEGDDPFGPIGVTPAGDPGMAVEGSLPQQPAQVTPPAAATAAAPGAAGAVSQQVLPPATSPALGASPAPSSPSPYVAIAPAIPGVTTAANGSGVQLMAPSPGASPADVAAAQQQQQQAQAFLLAASAATAGDNGQPPAMIPNPFLTLPQGASATVIMDRNQFLQAAFSARAKGRKRHMSAEQAERRRERNRELAKKTRERKKNHMGALQDEVMELQRANAELKAMVRNEMDEVEGDRLLKDCTAIDQVPQTVWEACGTDKKELAAEDFDMVSSIQKSQTAFVITDPSFEDNPIVFVSPDFLTLTGYKREEVIGRNCRFLQGTATSPDKIDQIRRALADGDDVGVTLINYKADGTPFWNRLFIAAVRDINDQIVNYMGVAVRVARPEPGDPEHEKELPS